MDEQLKNAAIHTDGSAAYLFLKEAAKNTIEYFKSVYVPTSLDEQGGNIFHLSAYHNNGDFIDAALKELPEEVVQHLLCQEDGNPEKKQNALHVAASLGHHWIVKLLLDYCSKDRRSIPLEPWLARDESAGRTPLHYVLDVGSQNQALKILSFVCVELVSSVEDKHGNSPLFLAVKRGYNQIADKILGSPASFSLRGSHGSTALFFAPNCSDYVCSRLLQEHSELIIDKDENTGNTVLHQWAKMGKTYPFNQVLRGDFIPLHLLTKFVGQLSATNNEGENPFHIVAKSKYDRARTVEVAQILVEMCELQRPDTSNKAALPWFTRSDEGSPLRSAINHQNEQLALYFLRLDGIYFVSENCEDDLLYLAVENGCSQVAQEILDMVDRHSLTQLLTIDNGRTVLHIAPRSTDAVLRQMLENYPQLIDESDEKRETVLHSWIKIGEMWPFEYVLKRDDTNSKWRSSFIHLLGKYDAEKRNPLHVAASSNNSKQVTEQIVELLLDALQKEYPDWIQSSYLPWLDKDRKGHRPLTEAMINRHEKLALDFLSWNQGTALLQLNDGEENVLFKAAECDCQKVVTFILDWVHKNERRDLLFSGQRSILHVGLKKCTEENCRLMIERWPELINEVDGDGKAPLERASEVGRTALVELILERDPSSIIEAPLAWVEACKNRHLSTVLAFAEKSTFFKRLCRLHYDTPLHHLGDLTYKECQLFLEHPVIKQLRNDQNIDDETPLHTAIRNNNKNMAEMLLRMSDVDTTIKDADNKTALDLLSEVCSRDMDWKEVWLSIKHYEIQVKMKELWSTIPVLATLLATITFTAAFTIPGGFNNDTGEAVLVKKAAFLAFLMADAYGMCCSVLILLNIMWSLLSESRRAPSLMLRSIVLFKQALYGTLLAFVTGIYTVIHHKSLWAAIVIIVMCSLVLISAKMTYSWFEMWMMLIPLPVYEYGKVPRWLRRCYGRILGSCCSILSVLQRKRHFQKEEPSYREREVEVVAVDIQRGLAKAARTDIQRIQAG